MSLQFVVKTLDGLDEATKSLYKQAEDGTFRLDVEGLEDTGGLKSALEKERGERKKLEGQMAKYKDIDPTKYDEAVKKLQEMEDERLRNEGKIDELIEQRVERLKKDHESQTQQLKTNQENLTQENTRLRQRLATVVIERGIIDAINESAVPRKEALQDIIARGSTVWKLDEHGNPVPLKPDGTTIFGKEGTKPMTMVEWAGDLVKEAPHLFMPSQGGGAAHHPGAAQHGLSAEQLAKLPPEEKLKLARRGAA